LRRRIESGINIYINIFLTSLLRVTVRTGGVGDGREEGGIGGISLGLCTVRKSILGSRLRVGTSSRLAETKRKKKVARGYETVSPHTALHYKEKKRGGEEETSWPTILVFFFSVPCRITLDTVE